MSFTQWIIAAFVVAYWAAKSYAGIVIGALWPVVSPAVLDNPRQFPPPEYRYVWDASSLKSRACSPADPIVKDAGIKMRWYNGERGGFYTPATSMFLDAPEVRPTGELFWDSLVVSLDPFELENNSFAFVYHNCPVRIFGITLLEYEVRSLFYDSALNL